MAWYDEAIFYHIYPLEMTGAPKHMMRAWYFATALAKQYKKTLPYIENNVLDTWTHNKTIQKAIESYRISDDKKRFLRTLKQRSH